MALIALFLMGTLNFALHKAVLESGHPLLGRLPWFSNVLGRRFSLAVEFALLLATMLMVDAGSPVWLWGYGFYSLANGLSAWLILTGRV